jgi:hypothetical protein
MSSSSSEILFSSVPVRKPNSSTKAVRLLLPPVWTAYPLKSPTSVDQMDTSGILRIVPCS